MFGKKKEKEKESNRVTPLDEKIVKRLMLFMKQDVD